MKFTTKDYEWTLDGLCKCIKDNNLQSGIIYSTPTAAIVWVKNYRDSQILGALSDWCICQHDVSWQQYVAKNKNNVQLFFYDFTQYPKSTFALVGATFTMKKEWSIMDLNCCFVRENHPIKEEMRGQHSDLEAMNHLLGKTFGIDFGKKSFLVECINKFKEAPVEYVSEPLEVRPAKPVDDGIDWDEILSERLGRPIPHQRIDEVEENDFVKEYPFTPSVTPRPYTTYWDDLLDDDLPW
jgi:hypothetical protein